MVQTWLLRLVLAGLCCGSWSWWSSGPSPAVAETRATFYNIGAPILKDIWVDPLHGNDRNRGDTRSQALRTISAAWDRIPRGVTLTGTGYRLRLVAGVYPESTVPSYWEARYGASQYPIIIEAADGAGTAVLPALDLYRCRYLYLVGLKVQARGGNVIHCASCNHILVRRCRVVGLGNIYVYDSPQETIKVNQSQYLYLEDCDISGAWNVAVDFVSTQYGHILRNRVHRALEWGIYLKGGSAYIRLEGNEIFDCGTGGFCAGDGTGFEYMVSPWLHYEAYDLKFINNLVHHTTGAGMGVNGGYNILLAHNTLYRVGRRDHVLEAVFGDRSCDGNVARCRQYLALGGWGTAQPGSEHTQPIPNRNIYVYNNLFYNPDAYQSQWAHLAIYGPRSPAPGSNIPAPARTDVNLQIRGNIIWNGPPSMPLGIEEADQGCQSCNPRCNAAQLRADNAVNTLKPQLVDPVRGNFRPRPGGNVLGARTFAIPAFPGGDRPPRPLAPAGDLTNKVLYDYFGRARPLASPPGAFLP